jgi:hypothetical protein
LLWHRQCVSGCRGNGPPGAQHVDAWCC